MSKRRASRSHRLTIRSAGRVTSANAPSRVVPKRSVKTRRYAPVLPRFTTYAPVYRSPLTEIEDFRLWHPEQNNYQSHRVSLSSVSASLNPSRLVPYVTSPYTGVMSSRTILSPRIAPAAPRKVILCIRRAKRRQTLFARGVAGSGTKNRIQAWSQLSKISCRRK